MFDNLSAPAGEITDLFPFQRIRFDGFLPFLFIKIERNAQQCEVSILLLFLINTAEHGIVCTADRIPRSPELYEQVLIFKVGATYIFFFRIA